MVQVPRKVSDKRNKSKVTRRQRATEPTAQRKFLRTGWDPVLFALRRAERFLGNMLDVPVLWETLIKMWRPKPTPFLYKTAEMISHLSELWWRAPSPPSLKSVRLVSTVCGVGDTTRTEAQDRRFFLPAGVPPSFEVPLRPETGQVPGVGCRTKK